MPKANETKEIKRWVTLPNGKQKRRSFYGASVAEAEEKWRNECKPAFSTGLKPGTFSWWIVMKWYPIHEGNKASTMDRYLGAIALLEPHIGTMPVESIDATVLATTLRKIGKQITKFGKPVAKSTILVCRRIALEVNQLAHEAGIGTRINTKRVKVKKDPVKVVATYTPVQLGRLRRAAEGSAAHGAVLLIGFLGLSINEARAVRGEDLQDGVLYVRHMPDESEPTGRTTEMKTEYRPRDLPLPPDLAAELAKFGKGWICRTRKGKLQGVTNLRKAIYAAEKRAGLHRLVPHEIRHSFSDALDAMQCPMGVRLRLMGQSREEVQYRYTHGTTMQRWLSKLWKASFGTDRDPTPIRLVHEHGGGPKTAPKGTKNGRSKLTEDQVAEIKRRIANNDTNVDIAADFPISAPMVSRIRNGKAWQG